jgi:serine/threonine protein kinase
MTDAMRETFGDILPASERARRLVGKTLDGYVLEEITKGGEGGFGVVYKASHPVIGKVAVKVLGIDVEADEKAYQRFKQEVRLLCEMGDAKNVVDIRHAGIVDGLPWFAMDYVDGESLHQWLGHKKIEKDDLITILSEMLEGLHQVQVECCKKRPDTRKSKTGGAASRLKNDGPLISIVHRDIKPGNVMIVEHESGEIGAMLIDFGIAGLFRERMEDVPSSNTSIPSMGTEFHRAYTPEYISPELCLSPESVTVKSDLFQVGLIAFEMMTGKRYWDVRTDAEKELKKAKGWPWWLKKVIAKSLSWDRMKRYSSPLEFQRALKQPFREAMKSLVLKPKRLAASIATIAIVVLTVMLMIKGPNGGTRVPYAELSARAAVVCQFREQFLEDNSPKTFRRLRIECENYLQLDDGRGSPFLSHAQELLKWMKAAKQGWIQIKPVMFDENIAVHIDDIEMRYRFSQGGISATERCSVNDTEDLSQDSTRFPSLDVPWSPGGEKIVIELEQSDDGKTVTTKVQKTWPITDDIIRKSDDELSKVQILKTEGSYYELSYTVHRSRGFGPIPKLPDLAK